MRLNAVIICERLRRKYPVFMYGRPNQDLSLLPPELYIDNTTRFSANHVYLATVEHLPHRPTIERGVVLVCIGDSPKLSYYKEHATVLLLNQKANFFEVYQALQEIYIRFQDWETRLLSAFTGSPTIQEVLDCSYPVFERPLFVLDEAFQFTGSVQPDGESQTVRVREALDANDFLTFLRDQDMRMEQKGVLTIDFGQMKFQCINLFSAQEDYIGCLFIDQTGQPELEVEEPLVEYLAGILEKVAERSPSLLKNKRSSFKELLQLIMREMPLTQNQKMLLKSASDGPYVCVSIHYLQRFSHFPVRYICSVFETMLPGSLLFARDDVIVGVAPASQFSVGSENLSDGSHFASYINETQLCVGISNEFEDLYLLRTYFFQAEAAIENGQLYRPGQNLYQFSDFTLVEMISNALGNFSLEAYYPNGFHKLLHHDLNSEISYLDTLEVFLEENMSYTQAARRLYVHRSTLVERIERIEQDLSLDMRDPDQRLLLQFILKARRMEQTLQK